MSSIHIFKITVKKALGPNIFNCEEIKFIIIEIEITQSQIYLAVQHFLLKYVLFPIYQTLIHIYRKMKEESEERRKKQMSRHIPELLQGK